MFLLVFALTVGNVTTLDKTLLNAKSYEDCMNIGNFMVYVVQNASNDKAMINYTCIPLEGK